MSGLSLDSLVQLVSVPSIMFQSSNKRHLPSFADRSVGPSLPSCLYFPHSLGISLLSAFYSKSNRRAFIQPNLGDSGYIWLA